MNVSFHLPTKVYFGDDCLESNSDVLKNYGKRVLIVTGKQSAKICGALDDVIKSLKRESIDYIIFDEVNNNPSIDNVRKGAILGKKEKVDFVIGCGGGSALDASKAIAILATNEISDNELFWGKYKNDVLPIISIPTTAGTGSEVTQYAVLNDDNIGSKHTISSVRIFPRISFVDVKYTLSLPINITINTAFDALSHAIEGYLSTNASEMSNLYAIEAMKLIGKHIKSLNSQLSKNARKQLIYASMLAGVVIAQTKTTTLHAMGYSLTYFKDIPHGKANGLLLFEYLNFISKYMPNKIDEVMYFLGFRSLNYLKRNINNLIKMEIKLSENEINRFALYAVQSKNFMNTIVVPDIKVVQEMYKTLMI